MNATKKLKISDLIEGGYIFCNYSSRGLVVIHKVVSIKNNYVKTTVIYSTNNSEPIGNTNWWLGPDLKPVLSAWLYYLTNSEQEIELLKLIT